MTIPTTVLYLCSFQDLPHSKQSADIPNSSFDMNVENNCGYGECVYSTDWMCARKIKLPNFSFSCLYQSLENRKVIKPCLLPHLQSLGRTNLFHFVPFYYKLNLTIWLIAYKIHCIDVHSCAECLNSVSYSSASSFVAAFGCGFHVLPCYPPN